MRILIGKLSVFILLSGYFIILPSNPPATADLTSGHIVQMGSAAPEIPLSENPSGQNFKLIPRWEIYEILFGTFLLLIGFATIGLSLFRWKANDLSLISFGTLSFLYGARTKAFQFLFDLPLPLWSYAHWFIIYLVPIPAWIFAEQFLGKGWKSSIRRLWQIQVVFSILAIALSGYSHHPSAAMAANNLMAIIGILVVMANFFQPRLKLNRALKVLRAGFFIFAITGIFSNIAPLLKKGYAGSYLEDLGFFIFICCLGYAVAHRFFQNEKELITISHELETARQIQSFILPGETTDIEGLQIAARYIPMASVAGDFYDFAKTDEEHLGILVADVSGHGVPASLISSMVKIAFASQASYVSNPARILFELNNILYGKLEADFVTAAYLFIDAAKGLIHYAAAGHPPLFLWRSVEEKIYEFREKGIILGQFQDVPYRDISFDLKAGDRIFLFTDGIVETSNSADDIFGYNRLKDFITRHADLSANQFADRFIQHLFDWSAKSSGEALDDDLTLIVADYKRV
jgi:sigma-B regulation protein RsbU (phosphoserine phosphatase)